MFASNRPLSIGYDPNDYYVQEYRGEWNRRSGNSADFSNVPTERIFEYRGHCYDLEQTINYFKDNWNKPAFYFTIDNQHQLSVDTMRKISDSVKYYNHALTTVYENPASYYHVDDTPLVYGELIKPRDFTSLL